MKFNVAVIIVIQNVRETTLTCTGLKLTERNLKYRCAGTCLAQYSRVKENEIFKLNKRDLEYSCVRVS